MEAFVAGELGFSGVIDGVGQPLGDDVIEVGVYVGLQRKHVGWGELIFGGSGFVCEDLPYTLIAIGRGPVEGDGVGVVVGCDARVGGGEDAVQGIRDLGEAVVWDGANPLLRGVEGIGGNGTDGAWSHYAAAERDCADGVVTDMALVVGVDEVLRWAAVGGEGGDQIGCACGRVDSEEGRIEAGGVVDGPAQRERSLF